MDVIGFAEGENWSIAIWFILNFDSWDSFASFSCSMWKFGPVNGNAKVLVSEGYHIFSIGSLNLGQF